MRSLNSSQGLSEEHGVGGCAAEGGGAEVVHQRDLLLCVAGGYGDDTGADVGGSVVGTQTAGEQPIAVRDLEDVFLRGSVGGEGAGDALRPHCKVLACVKHYNRLAGGAGRGVDAHNLAHRDGGKAEGVVVAKARLVCKWQFGDVLDAVDVIGREVHLLEPLAVERGVVVTVIHNFFQSSTLDFAQLVAVHTLNTFVPIHVLGVNDLLLFNVSDSGFLSPAASRRSRR